MPLSTVTVTGTWETGQNQPATGKVVFTPVYSTSGGGYIIAGTPISAQLINGAISIALVSNAEATQLQYSVSEQIDGALPVTYVITPTGATINLATVPRTGATSPTYLLSSSVGQQGGIAALTAYGSQQLLTQRTQALMRFRAALADRHYTRCNIVVLGDSIVEGQGATAVTNRWIARLRDLLRQRCPSNGVTTGGRGYLNTVSTGSGSFTWPTTTTGNPDQLATGPKTTGLSINTTKPTATCVFNLVGDSADIMWQRQAFGGTFGYKVDSGSVVNVDTNGASNLDGMLTHVNLGSAGAHTLTISYVSGYSDVNGVIEYNGDYTTGITVHDVGHFGAATSAWTGPLTGTTGAAAAIAALNPHLIVIALGVNDQAVNTAPATYQTNLQNIITNLRAVLPAPLPSIVLAMYPPRPSQGTYTYAWQQYVNAAWNVALADTAGPGGASAVTVLDYTLGPRMLGADTDLYSLWAAGDTVHPSNRGHALLADYSAEFLLTP